MRDDRNILGEYLIDRGNGRVTRASQDIRIKKINRQLVIMANLVEKQIYESMLSLKNYNIKLADNIIKGDDKVDELQKVIEEQCIKFIAMEQPLATDLRKVMTASKIVTDLERMADHAVDICKITKKLGGNINSFKNNIEPLWEMEEKVRSMIDLAIHSYIESDDDTAYKICKKDDEIDSIYKSLFAEFINDIKLDESLAEKKIRLLFVIKYLERIGDHVTNICEWTIYSKSGVYIDLNE